MAADATFVIFIAQLGFVLTILGGHDVTIDQTPYQVNYGDICGGVLIHKKWAVTSAHCARRRRDFIRIGSRHRKRGPRVRIISHLQHPRFGVKHMFDYDIQLLELKNKLFFGKTVSAIEICDGDCGDNFLISGWGFPNEKGDHKEILQKVSVSLVEFNHCQEIKEAWYNHTLTSRMFCAGDEKHDACQGDSGGAAVSKGALVGLSSFGLGCGRVPGVYTDLSNVDIRNWIRKHAGV